MKISSFQSTSSGGASGSGSGTGYGTSGSFHRTFNLQNLSKLMLPPLGYSQMSPAGTNKWVVSPLDSRYRWWETFMVVLVAYSAWVYPFEVAFMYASPRGGLEVADVVVDLFFAVDIVLTFFVRNRKRITSSM